MSFRSRLLLLCGLIVLLTAALVLGILLSPDRVQARSAGRSLLSVSPDQIVGFDVTAGGSVEVSLVRDGSAWQVKAGSLSYPASAPRVSLFLRSVSGLTRGALVTRDTGHFAELGVSGASAHGLVLHRSGGLKDAALTVGRRGPSGDEDYVLLDGETRVSLVRGSLGFFLSQERPSWYELHVLPDDVQGTTIASVTVRGSLSVDGTAARTINGPYTLVRNQSQQGSAWSMQGEKRPVTGSAAAAMVSSLALLEGIDFAVDGEARAAGAGALFCDVTTAAGKTYSLTVRPGSRPGTLDVTTTWSPWTYIVNALPLERALVSRDALLAQP